MTILERTDDRQAFDAIANIVRQHDVEKLVAGLPLTRDGTPGHQAEKIKTFLDGFIAATGFTVEFRDESLTTRSARKLMQQTRGRKKREKEKDDAIAAAFILQNYLDEIRGNDPPF